jgi:O-antigen ligase
MIQELEPVNRKTSQWVIYFFLLLVIIFATPYDIFTSVKGDITAEELSHGSSKVTAEGNVQREIGLLSLGIFGVITLLSRPRKPFKMNGFVSWVIIFFLLWVSLSIFWAEDIRIALRRWVVLATITLGAAGVEKRLTTHEIMIFTLFSALSAMLAGFICEMSLGTFHPLGQDYRFSGLQQPNVQALECAILFIVSLILGRATKRRRYLYFLIGLIAISFLFLTKSRTVFWSSILASLGYYALDSSRYTRLAYGLFITGLICLSLLLFGDELVKYGMKAGLMYTRLDSAETLTGRIPLWKECLHYVAQRPILGYGYNSFWTPKHILEFSANRKWSIPNAHNGYIDMMLGLGIPGGVAIILVLVNGIIRYANLYKLSRNKGYAFGFALFVFYGLANLLGSRFLEPSLITLIVVIFLIKMSFKGVESPEIRVKRTDLNINRKQSFIPPR